MMTIDELRARLSSLAIDNSTSEAIDLCERLSEISLNMVETLNKSQVNSILYFVQTKMISGKNRLPKQLPNDVNIDAVALQRQAVADANGIGALAVKMGQLLAGNDRALSRVMQVTDLAIDAALCAIDAIVNASVKMTDSCNRMADRQDLIRSDYLDLAAYFSRKDPTGQCLVKLDRIYALHYDTVKEMFASYSSSFVEILNKKLEDLVSAIGIVPPAGEDNDQD